MKLAAVSILLVAGVMATQSHAEAREPTWTLSAHGSWSESDGSGRDAVSTSVSLSRAMDEGSIGASIGSSNGSDAFLDATEITDRTSVFGSLWVSLPVGLLDAELSVSYGQEDYEGEVLISEALLEAIGDVEVASEVDDVAVNAAVSRTFTSGNWDLVPNASIGWSRSDATTSLITDDDVAIPTVLNDEQSGVLASAGLGVGYLANQHLYVFSEIVGLYADNGAAAGVGATTSQNNRRASLRQDPDAATWAELSIGASVYASNAVTLSLTGGTTLGRDEEEVFASTSVSVGF